MNIIVTGCSSGIGYQTVLALARKGARLIYGLSRNEEGLKKLEEEVKATGTGAVLVPIVFDLASGDFAELLTLLDLGEHNRVDILINNAGVLVNKPFTDLSDYDWQRTFEVNFFAAVRLIRLIYPYFNRREGAHIVNIGSMGGVQGREKFPGLSAYSASKAALNVLGESLSVEFEKEGIAVNVLNPGAVETKMFREAFPGSIAPVSDSAMGEFVAHFALNNSKIMNGRLVEVSLRG